MVSVIKGFNKKTQNLALFLYIYIYIRVCVCEKYNMLFIQILFFYGVRAIKASTSKHKI